MAVVYIVLGLGFGFRRICLDVWLFLELDGMGETWAEATIICGYKNGIKGIACSQRDKG